MNKETLGSKTPKSGFTTEFEVINRFNNWKNDPFSKEWLIEMGYNLNTIESVIARKVPGHYKADIQVQIEVQIKLKNLYESQNLQIKLISNKNAYNQIDKRWISKYQELWSMPENVVRALKFYTGELSPYIDNPKSIKRMFFNELKTEEQKCVIDFF